MYIYSSYITLKNGRRIYAKDCGKKAFRFWVDDNDDNRDVTKRF